MTTTLTVKEPITMILDQLGLTADEQKMYAVLEDGLAHRTEQLRRCLNATDDGVVRLCGLEIKRKLAAHGLSVICFREGPESFYQLRRRIGNR
jgi:hypothetical protein